MHPTSLIRAFVRNIQHGAARLAVHGINIMAEEATGRASEPHFCWADQYLCKTEKEGYAENHDYNGDQTTRRTRQGDVAEARCRQRGNREVQRIRIVVDAGIRTALRFVNHARHNEYED